MGVATFIHSCGRSRRIVAEVLEFCRRLMCSCCFFPASASVNVETLLIIMYLILKLYPWSPQEWVVSFQGVLGLWRMELIYCWPSVCVVML